MLQLAHPPFPIRGKHLKYYQIKMKNKDNVHIYKYDVKY